MRCSLPVWNRAEIRTADERIIRDAENLKAPLYAAVR